MSKTSPTRSKPYQVGLTGGIGAGKTLVGKVFATLGVPVFNADLSGRYILDKDSEVQKEVTALLGEEAYRDGQANRPYIASKVFGNDSLREALNNIIHPAVGRDYQNWLNDHADKPYVLKESAITFETGIYKQMDANVLVSAPEYIRLKRALSRDAVAEADIRKRMKAQWTDEEKRALSTFEIRNNEDEAILPQILDIHQQIIANLS